MELDPTSIAARTLPAAIRGRRYRRFCNLGLKMSVFPPPDRPRLWGVAVSHYQVEGGDPCDWTEWEGAGRTKGGACGRAAGSWERYEEDADLAAAAGANAFRFSVSWSRVEPARGDVRRRGARALRAVRGPAPRARPRARRHAPPLHAPAVVSRRDAVDVPGVGRSVRALHAPRRRGARAAREGLGPLNEPLVLLLGGYLDGQIPPASPTAARRASRSGTCTRRTPRLPRS